MFKVIETLSTSGYGFPGIIRGAPIKTVSRRLHGGKRNGAGLGHLKVPGGTATGLGLDL